MLVELLPDADLHRPAARAPQVQKEAGGLCCSGAYSSFCRPVASPSRRPKRPHLISSSASLPCSSASASVHVWPNKRRRSLPASARWHRCPYCVPPRPDPTREVKISCLSSQSLAPPGTKLSASMSPGLLGWVRFDSKPALGFGSRELSLILHPIPSTAWAKTSLAWSVWHPSLTGGTPASS